MVQCNPHYQHLAGEYLFAEIAKRVKLFSEKNSETARDKKLIRLGIGDVTMPLCNAVVEALRKAVDEQASSASFRGYGPEQGYAFLREAIVEDCFSGLGVQPDEIFVSDGAKCDLGNFQELFDQKCTVAITDPVYPVYADSNVMAGRAGAQKDGRFQGLLYLPCTAENSFVPDLPAERPDIIYLCYPNNPTGAVLTREQLARWVDYAARMDSVILYDAAYEAFISTPGIPRSIYEIEGARNVAVEFRSYSKSAGFTGLRCGYAVVPKSVKGRVGSDVVSLHSMWLRRQSTKYNGCPYIVQRAAEAVHSPAGHEQCAETIAAYMKNAGLIRDCFTAMGLSVSGGIDAPYIWLRLPPGLGSWEFFDMLLTGPRIVGTPGTGFGPCGEGYFRLTAFGDAEDTREAMRRLKNFSL